MADQNVNGMFLNMLFSTLYRKVEVPTDFHSRANVVQSMLSDDISGLVQSLTDFQVNAANVKWTLKTGNSALDNIYLQWQEKVNSGFRGQIPSGINALAIEYYKERWKGSSFPILKVLEWDEIEGYYLPMKVVFIDGSKVYSDLSNSKSESGIFSYTLGQTSDAEKLDKSCLITKPFGRWYDEYPEVYLIRNGVYHNFYLLKSLKTKQSEVLEQILPYLLTIKKGTEQLAIGKNVNYDNKKLEEVVTQVEKLLTKMSDVQVEGHRKSKTPIRATQFDEEISHLLPDLKTILNIELGAAFEKGILGGIGFIDIADAVSTSRRESILNPKAFIQEIQAGIGTNEGGTGFSQVLKDLNWMIKDKNKTSTKYNSQSFRVYHNEPQIFVDKDFRDTLISLYNRGKLSQKTLIEVAGKQVYEEELNQRKLEAKEGNEFFMYPPVVQNIENGMNDNFQFNTDTDKDLKTTEEKLSPDAKEKYSSAFEKNLIGSPYSSIAKLPDAVKEALPKLKERRKWLAIFNQSYNYYLGKFSDNKKAETMAFKTAWSKVKTN